uniref:prostaglandin-endoperoxide synthase n=1 Tax=Macellomenia sp. JCH-2014 TaxID=1541964 RepID=A0A0U2LJ89_9MOLL|nr:cyclooxygenase [Macellomenia sp. JCH-2014]
MMRIDICSKMFSFIVIIIVMMSVAVTADPGQGNKQQHYHPCCSFPCQNDGVCMSRGFTDYECDCTNTPFYGRNCQHATWLHSIKLFLKPSPTTVHTLLTNHGWLWSIINSISYLHDKAIRYVYISRGANIVSPPTHLSSHEYITMEANLNHSLYSRALPPVHKNCPTPMGVAGRKFLPDSQDVVDRLFKRDKFKPDPIHHSVHLPYFAQHFTHQFFKTDFTKGPDFQTSRHGVDGSNIYGGNNEVEGKLRSHIGGRLKSQILKGEEYPPYLKDVDVPMRYRNDTPEDRKFALGHEFYSVLPGLFLYSTIWLREHNRVAGILMKEHPDWDDEQLFQTTKLIIIGETIQIVIADYVQHLSNYNFDITFDPPVVYGSSFQFSTRISLEFNHLYHWHPMMPDDLHVDGKTYGMEDIYGNIELVTKYGVAAVAKAFTKQLAGAMTYRNHGAVTQHVIKEVIEHGRELRFQSFNNYRKRFGLEPYTSFQQLTDNEEISGILEEMYGDIDGVEFFVGLVTEKVPKNAKFGLSLLEMGASHSVTGLISNPICSPAYWKPSTFGGNVGFDIIKMATLERLFCNNIEGDCPEISFSVPEKYRNAAFEQIKKPPKSEL